MRSKLMHLFVIAGLDPAIHRAKRIISMDVRVKPAHDAPNSQRRP
jgi:hypothetical protein